MSSERERPTPPRPSSTIHVFEQACSEAIDALESLGLDDRGRKLLHEANELATMYRAWKKHPPGEAERHEAASRTMALHAGVAEYMAVRRAPG